MSQISLGTYHLLSSSFLKEESKPSDQQLSFSGPHTPPHCILLDSSPPFQ